MILALDTSTAACTAALLAPGGEIVALADERINRGHAERLAPMIAELLDGNIPTRILVGVGPGSFTGIRVGVACAHGLAIGWDVPLAGMNSLALIAAGAPGDGVVAVAVVAGHGELFVQQFDRCPLRPVRSVESLRPDQAAKAVDAPLIVGSGAAALVAARGWGEALELFPTAAHALQLPDAMASLDPRPAYARAPDAQPANARPRAAA